MMKGYHEKDARHESAAGGRVCKHPPFFIKIGYMMATRHNWKNGNKKGNALIMRIA
jgi:hypothetical protein